MLLFNKSEIDRFARAFRAAMMVKVLDKGTSPFYSVMTPFICSVPFLSRRPTFVSKSLNQVASFTVRVNATYSASFNERATIAYLLENHLTGPPFSMKIKLNVDFLLTWLLPQSESK